MAQKHAIITEDMLAALKGRIGVEFTPKEPWFNTSATVDSVRHFANGIGDDNPLYCDTDYASKTKYGRIVATPLFLYSNINVKY